ncbi:retrotransposon hot spot protein (RHS) [Trypanosoma cruzi]|nr:retrotransposon hot spot protein (RHS) [Trypanosoma cruzi]
MGNVTAVAVVECSRIGAFGDFTWSAEQRGAAHAQEVGVSAATDQTFLRACCAAAFLFGKKPFAGIMRLPSEPHEAVGNFLGLIGGVAPHPCRVVDLYSAVHGDGDVR